MAPCELEASPGSHPSPRARCVLSSPSHARWLLSMPPFLATLPAPPDFSLTHRASVHTRGLLPLTAWLFAAVLVRAGQLDGWVTAAPELKAATATLRGGPRSLSGPLHSFTVKSTIRRSRVTSFSVGRCCLILGTTQGHLRASWGHLRGQAMTPTEHAEKHRF